MMFGMMMYMYLSYCVFRFLSLSPLSLLSPGDREADSCVRVLWRLCGEPHQDWHIQQVSSLTLGVETSTSQCWDTQIHTYM